LGAALSPDSGWRPFFLFEPKRDDGAGAVGQLGRAGLTRRGPGALATPLGAAILGALAGQHGARLSPREPGGQCRPLVAAMGLSLPRRHSTHDKTHSLCV
jgi:hypothetical protein